MLEASWEGSESPYPPPCLLGKTQTYALRSCVRNMRVKIGVEILFASYKSRQRCCIIGVCTKMERCETSPTDLWPAQGAQKRALSVSTPHPSLRRTHPFAVIVRVREYMNLKQIRLAALSYHLLYLYNTKTILYTAIYLYNTKQYFTRLYARSAEYSIAI